MDATVNRAHQHAAGARRGEEVALGRSVGGFSTKVHMLADAHGNPLEFSVTEGQQHDVKQALSLAKKTQAPLLLADKGYDSQPFRDALLELGVTAVIPRRENSDKPNPGFDSHLYKDRHTVENLFARLKQCRAFATRYDKLKRNYEAVVFITCFLIWINLLVN